MLQYICVVTNENESRKDNFIHSISFHTSYMEANEYANEITKSLNGESDFYIYRNLALLEDDFLNQNLDKLLPF